MRWLMLWIVASGLIMVLGCQGNNNTPSDTEPPIITDVEVFPRQLRFTGGEFTISTKVSDRSGVKEVWAVVQKPDGTKATVTLSLLGDRYEGKFKTETNTRSDGKSLVYIVWGKAKDEKGNETPDPGVGEVKVEVNPPIQPPEGPSW